MRGLWVVGLVLLCAGCASSAPSEQMVATVVPECRQFTAPATIDGSPQQLAGLACRQPDGTWMPVEAVSQVYASPGYAVPAAPPDAAVAPNCAYPMAAQYTEQCNWYINRHKFGRR